MSQLVTVAYVRFFSCTHLRLYSLSAQPSTLFRALRDDASRLGILDLG